MPDSQSPKPSRREILGGSLSSVPRENSESVILPTDYGPLFHFSANAMGCEFQVMCSQDARESVVEVIDSAFELITELEDQMSIYREASEMSAINRLAGSQPVTVESRLYDLLKMARQISIATQKAFDISATPLSRLWKSHRDLRSLPDADRVAKTLGEIGSEFLVFDDERQTVQFSNSQLQLDLGGIGKGHALDRLKELMLAAGCHDFLIHGGQSSVLASGGRQAADGTNLHPWQVGISHPLNAGKRLANLTLNERAIGTSGCGRKAMVVNGKRYGHIIDPRTGWPADKCLSVTVLASSAAQADALATAIFVAGPEQAQRICDQFDLSAILTEATSSGLDISLTTINLAESDIQLT